MCSFSLQVHKICMFFLFEWNEYFLMSSWKPESQSNLAHLRYSISSTMPKVFVNNIADSFANFQVMYEYVGLENFWKRYNKVLLDKVALDKEKMTLGQENQQLRMLLKQYLDGISVNDEILTQVNPLFVVNNKTNVK